MPEGGLVLSTPLKRRNLQIQRNAQNAEYAKSPRWKHVLDARFLFPMSRVTHSRFLARLELDESDDSFLRFLSWLSVHDSFFSYHPRFVESVFAIRISELDFGQAKFFGPIKCSIEKLIELFRLPTPVSFFCIEARIAPPTLEYFAQSLRYVLWNLEEDRDLSALFALSDHFHGAILVFFF